MQWERGDGTLFCLVFFGGGLLLFGDKVSLYSLGWSQTHYMDQAGLLTKIYLALASPVLVLKSTPAMVVVLPPLGLLPHRTTVSIKTAVAAVTGFLLVFQMCHVHSWHTLKL